MAFGPEPLGLAYFAGVKLLGYSGAGYRLNRLCGTAKPHPALFGVTRTAVGLVVGVAFAMATLQFGIGHSGALFYLVLAPVRMCEWLFVLWLFYRSIDGARRLRYALIGSAWSYLLDLPAILAVFAVPGGAWIC